MAKSENLKITHDTGSFFNSICECVPFGMFVIDIEGACIYANAEYRTLTELAASEIPGTGWSRTIHPEDRRRILETLYTATESHESFSTQYRIVKRDGTHQCMFLRATPITSEGKITGIVGAVENITLRLKMESQLRINFAAMESSTSMIMITDERGLITWVNPAFSHGTGYSFAEIDGKSPSFLSVGQDSPVAEALKNIVAGGEPWKGEVFNKRKDGTIFLEEEIITPIMEADGKISHFLAIKRDITEQRKNERKLAEYSEHLEDLVTERTHELQEAQKRIVLQLQLEQDLALAAQIQMSLLPTHPPAISGFDISCRAFAAHYISGDLYDFVLKDSRYLYIVMADISGKGVPAALLSASARIILREKIFQTSSPSTILDLVNRSLYADLNKTEMFITIMLAKIDIETGECSYSNAGHTRTMHWHGKTSTIDYLGATCLPVGIFPVLDAQECTIQLDVDDVLFFYSDGLTEATSSEGHLLGEDALADLLHNKLQDDSEQQTTCIIDTIIEYVETFAGNSLPDDDRSLILIKRQNKRISHTILLNALGFAELISMANNESLKFGEIFSSELELVITELLTNIIRHAYGLDPEQLPQGTEDFQGTDNPKSKKIEPSVEISFSSEPNRLSVDIFDWGIAFDQTMYTAPDPLNLQVGGYGYLLIRKLTDIVVYTRDRDNRNHWHLEKHTKDIK